MDIRFGIVLLIVFAACGDPSKDNSTEAPLATSAIWELPERLSSASMRGLDVCRDKTIWASGTEGTVLRSLDQGKSWQLFEVPEVTELDFRDIEGFDAEHASVMSAGNGVRAFSTTDGGKTWHLAYEDSDSSQFFDGMDFLQGVGYAFGDPNNGRLQILKSVDSGMSWTKLPDASLPRTLEGEAGYAASGTGIILRSEGLFIATGGGASSRLLIKSSEKEWQAFDTPLKSEPGSGIFSMAMDSKHFIVVGGSYVDSTNSSSNAAYSSEGSNWFVPKTLPEGYRSCVTTSKSLGIAVACGRTGCDISFDSGESWTYFSNEGFFSCAIVDSVLIGVGRNGKIGRFQLAQLAFPVGKSN